MEPTEELLDEIYRERVLRARRMSPEEKLLAGPRLFDEACEQMRSSLRLLRPYAGEAEIEEIMSHILDLLRRRDEAGRYIPSS